MSLMLEQSAALEELRLADFERTQLLDLNTEITALNSLYSILSPILHDVPNSTTAWNFRGRWYEVLWLSVYPFLQWLTLFSGVVASASIGQRASLYKTRFQFVRWILLILAAPVLALFTIFWNLAYYYVPAVVFILLRAGAYFTITENMIQNVDIDQALEYMVDNQKAGYNQSIAELLLLVSAITYTRDSRDYADAQNIYRELVTHYGKSLPTKPILSDFGDQRHKILTLLKDSEATMRQYALALGMEVSVISELDSGFGGPTASFFASQIHNVLIVAVRGTNPFDARELLVDAAFDKVVAKSEYFEFLQGRRNAYLHRGFYSSLFPADKSDHYPAKRIVAAIKEKARIMRLLNHTQDKVHVYITGHSLGAAIASILSASINDLGSDVEMHDTYLYGTPMSSNAAFCTAFRHEPRRKVWRIINQRDFVTKIPPSVNVLASDSGVGEMMDADKIFDGSILDYSAIGYGIRYHNHGGLPDGLNRIKCVLNSDPNTEVRLVWWIRLLEKTPLRSLVNHSPRSYSAAMARAREVLTDHSVLH